MKTTIKQLSQTINVPEATIRAWVAKPQEGVEYSRENLNYGNLAEKLISYYPDFQTKFGYAPTDITIEKAVRSEKHYLLLEELLKHPLTKITLHNYSLKKDLTFVTFYEIESDSVFLFRNETKGNYEVYTSEELAKENIKIEAREELK